MPSFAHRGAAPAVAPGAWVAPTATLVGAVTVAAGARICHGAVLNAEDGTIAVGATTIVLENAVLRAAREHPLELGPHCVVGPHAYLSGCSLADRVFVATGARVFNGASLGSGSEVRIGAVVHLRTRLGPGAVVPIGWVAVGDPAQILAPGEHDAIWAAQEPLDFPGYVFGVDRNGPDPMGELTGRWSRSLGRHADDDLR